ncbi:hypothetical protein C8J56DRAFT_1057932 [Mycena floridula]|nr:hypothetical protein C8J56DRAFT_1057932 [Mycena floridula]
MFILLPLLLPLSSIFLIGHPLHANPPFFRFSRSSIIPSRSSLPSIIHKLFRETCSLTPKRLPTPTPAPCLHFFCGEMQPYSDISHMESRLPWLYTLDLGIARSLVFTGGVATVRESRAVDGLMRRLGQSDIHPRFSIVTSSVLYEQAFMAHWRARTTILQPAIGNVVRSIVLEANDGYRDDGEEPGMQESGAARPVNLVIKAARLSPEDVVLAWRDEGIRLEGIDWIERRQNETRTREVNVSRTREANETIKGQGNDSWTNSSTSTSPVLSTTTLQTTTSPPPVDPLKPTVCDPVVGKL